VSGDCRFCGRGRSEVRVRADESEAKVDLHACDRCWGLLKNPKTGLALIRGNLSIALRGKVPDAPGKEAVDKFIAMLSELKPRR
jgi:hypothetical protein